MVIPLKNATKYGVVLIDNYLSFIGFCKNVDNEENVNIEVYLDDVKIDEILANKHLEKIEKIYDIDGFSFQYELPDKFYDKSYDIKFKSGDYQINDTQIKTIDPSNENYNKYRFLHSLSLPIAEEKIKDVYCPNSIGFLATKENLEDVEFVEYINQIMKDFPNCKFKALVFNNNLNSKITNLFTSKDLEIIKISNIYEVAQNIEVYLSNYERTFDDNYENGIIQFIRNHFTDIFGVGLGLQRKNITINQLEMDNQNYFKKFFDNLEYLGFDNNDISKYGKTYHEIYFKKACEKYGVDIGFDMNETVSKAYVYWNLKLGLSNHEFFKYTLKLAKKFAKLQ